MSIVFYCRPPQGTTTSLMLSMRTFEILADLLHLETDEDYTGSLAPETFLSQLTATQHELQHHGQEWSLAPEPTPTGQDIHALKRLGRPGLDSDNLRAYLSTLEQLARTAQASNVPIRWG